MGKIKWGILGPGKIAHQFAHDFQFVSNAELAAVASRSLDRSKAFGKDYGIPNSYGSYEELYNDPNIDAIYVATPHVFHFEQSKKALCAGKSVLCEKPITINPKQCDELIEVAQKESKYLMEGMWTYFLPAIRTAKEWVTQGRIGKVLHVKSDFGYAVPFDADGRMYNPELAGGAVLDMGIYNIAMAWWFLRKNPIDMHVKVHKAISGVDDDVVMQFQYDDELASLHTSFRCKLDNTTYVVGEKGYIAIPDFWRAKEAKLYESENMIDHFVDSRTGFGFNYELESVSQDLIHGKLESDIMTHQNSRQLQDHMSRVMKLF